MNILYVNPRSMSEPSGGGLESRKIYTLLLRLSQKQPGWVFKCISTDQVDEIHLASVKKTKIKDVLARLFGHSNYLWWSWHFSDLRHIMVSFNPDLLVLGSSRLGFIARDIKKISPSVRIIGQYQNVELDYVYSAHRVEKVSLQALVRQLEYALVKRDEGLFGRHIDAALFLTRRDQYRTQRIYQVQIEKSAIIPICLESKNGMLQKNSQGRQVLAFIGSLWYDSNVEGLRWFLAEVWPMLRQKNEHVHLIIGGSRPSLALEKELGQQPGVELYADFSNIEDILPASAIMISPILKGAGMKVKIAEALSLGLRIVGSTESFVGYEELLEDPASTGIVQVANHKEEYLRSLYEMLQETPMDVAVRAKSLQQQYYSLERASSQLSQLLLEVMA